MKRMIGHAGVALLAMLLVAGWSGCVMEDRSPEIVLTEETCTGFDVDDSGVSFAPFADIYFTDELNMILQDNDVTRTDIVSARIVSVSYGVTQFAGGHDWLITGAVTVERLDVSDGPATLLEYTSVSVQEALGKRIPASVTAEGAAVINRALEAFIAGGNPVLRFTVSNTGVTPTPSALDRIVFTWEPCLVAQIVVKQDVEVPDPF